MVVTWTRRRVASQAGAIGVVVGVALSLALMSVVPASAVAQPTAPAMPAKAAAPATPTLTTPTGRCTGGSITGVAGRLAGPASCPPPPPSPPGSNSSCGAGNFILSGLSDLDPSCFVKNIFGVPSTWPSATITEWVIKIAPYEKATTGSIASAMKVMQGAGLALLGAFATFSVFYYFASGLTSGGGGGAIFDAVVRVGAAGVFIAAWPWLFRNGLALTETLTNDLVPTGKVMALTSIGADFVTGPLSLITSIILDLALVIVTFALIGIKLALSAGLLVAYLLVPLALALWAIPAVAGPAEYPLRMCGMVLTTQLSWGVSVMVVADLWADTRGWNSPFGSPGGGAVLDNLIKPLVDVAVLWGMLRIPAHTARAWRIHKGAPAGRGLMTGMVLGGLLRGGSMFGGATAPAGGRHATPAHGMRGAARAGASALTTAASVLAGQRPTVGGARAGGGRHAGPARGGGSSGSGRGGSGRGAASAGGAAGGGGAGGGAAGGGSGRHAAPSGVTPTSNGAPAGHLRGPRGELVTDRGLPTGPGPHDADMRGLRDTRAASPPTVSDTAGAIGAIDTYAGGYYSGAVRDLLTSGATDGTVTSTLADSARGGEAIGLGSAFRTIGAASPGVRAQAVRAMTPSGANGSSPNGSRNGGGPPSQNGSSATSGGATATATAAAPTGTGQPPPPNA